MPAAVDGSASDQIISLGAATAAAAAPAKGAGASNFALNRSAGCSITATAAHAKQKRESGKSHFAIVASAATAAAVTYESLRLALTSRACVRVRVCGWVTPEKKAGQQKAGCRAGGPMFDLPPQAS